MEDAFAIIGQWIGLVKSAKLSIAEVSQDCEARVAAGVVVPRRISRKPCVPCLKR